MRHFTVLLTTLTTLLLAACASVPGYPIQTAPTPLPRVQSVTLNRPVTIRADRASEYIQHGAVLPYEKISHYYPHCIFGLRTQAGVARTIQPDTFTVTGLNRDRSTVMARGMMFASTGGDYSMVMSVTTLDLHSGRQPEVFQLICQQLDEAWRMHHVSRDEMQQALGDLITLD